ncbi:MAG: molybdopterin-guanine dinucleotide biosynthesis protein A [Hyphomicrobiales bacterium]|nr:molybdopterin-guanine dinucleotide biosynthesis protein A [Hyphomicrobiales bacterium]
MDPRKSIPWRRALAALAVLAAAAVPALAEDKPAPPAAAAPAPATDDGDRHAGYYYPDNVTHEIYGARARVLDGASRERRIGFVTAIAAQQASRPYPAKTAMFAKGTEAEKLIIVSLVDGHLNTIYRARAALALLTAGARTTPIFQQFEVESVFTFLDLCKLLGFKQVTISDGKEFAHQIEIR